MKKTRTLFIWILAGLYIFGAAIFILIVNYEMRNEALKAAESQARMLLDRNLATHTYFTHQLKPHLFQWSEDFRDPEEFQPVWMSSTYAIRQMQQYFGQLNPSGYYYKEAAINARSPENEADATEKAFIERLNADPGLTISSDIRTIDDQPYFVTMRRGEAMEQSCLRCHSTPETAPGEMVAEYGPERSFHRETGEVISAVSIRIPLQEAYAHANRLSMIFSAVLLTILGVFFAVVLGFTRRRIFDPIDQIRKQNRRIAESDRFLGEPMPLPKGQEMRELTESFNTMSMKLRRQIDELEARVKRRTEAYRASEAKYRAMMEGMPDPAYVCAPDYTVAYMNSAMIDRIGRDATGESCFKGIRGRDEVCEDCPYPDVKRGEFIQREQTSPIDGCIYNVTYAPIENPDGSVSKLSIYRDITAFKEMEAELFNARKFEAFATMAGGIAHDFNNLMTVILGYISMAATGKIPGEVREMLNIAENSCFQAQKLTRRLIVLTRETGPDRKPENLQAIIEQIVRSALKESEQMTSEFNIDENLEPVAVDRVQMEHAFMEIVNNAKEAMPGGGILRVTITRQTFPDGEEPGPFVHAPGPYIRIRFDDTGNGIAPADLHKVFDPYFSTKPMGSAKGAGLGMATAYAVIKKHQGYIRVDSKPGEGTSVIIDLPLM